MRNLDGHDAVKLKLTKIGTHCLLEKC